MKDADSVESAEFMAFVVSTETSASSLAVELSYTTSVSTSIASLSKRLTALLDTVRTSVTRTCSRVTPSTDFIAERYASLSNASTVVASVAEKATTYSVTTPWPLGSAVHVAEPTSGVYSLLPHAVQGPPFGP